MMHVSSITSNLKTEKKWKELYNCELQKEVVKGRVAKLKSVSDLRAEQLLLKDFLVDGLLAHNR